MLYTIQNERGDFYLPICATLRRNVLGPLGHHLKSASNQKICPKLNKYDQKIEYFKAFTKLFKAFSVELINLYHNYNSNTTEMQSMINYFQHIPNTLNIF